MKISTDQIEGFAEMTAEQKLEALLNIEVPDPVDLSKYVEKRVFDEKASEAGKLSRQLKEMTTNQDTANGELQVKLTEMEGKLKQLELEKTESAYKAKFLSMPGYDEKLAEEAAKAAAAGDFDKVFENQKLANAAHEKTLKADFLRGTPRPDGAGSGNNEEKSTSVLTAEKIGKSNSDAATTAQNIISMYTGGNK